MHEAGFISGYHSLQSNLYYKLKGEWEELLPQVYVPLESPSHLWLAVPLPAPSSTFGASVMPASWPASSLGEETLFQKVKTKVLHEKKKKKRWWFEYLRAPFVVLQVGGNPFISLAIPFILLRLCWLAHQGSGPKGRGGVTWVWSIRASFSLLT